MRWLSATLVLLTVSLAIPASAGGDLARSAGHKATGNFYFGRVAFEDDVIGIALDRSNRIAKVFVTDAEPGGHAEWFQGTLVRSTLRMRSASGRARLRATFDRAEQTWSGTIKLPGVKTRRIAAFHADKGAGLYDVRVTRSGRYFGRSTGGERLRARRSGRFLTGAVIERNGKRLGFKVMDLSRAFRYRIRSGRPGRYTVIVSRNGTLHYGRGGGQALKRGRPSRNLVAFDIDTTPDPTPGFYFGRVGFERDVLGVKLDSPDAQGSRRVRVYVSDSEPEPRGDLEWFTGQSTGNTVNLTSVGGRARLRATIEPGLVSGTITYSGGRKRRFFALPAGQGAGIYDVTVTPDGRMKGSSEEGGRLTASQDGNFVKTSVTTLNGQKYDNRGADLTRTLRYPAKGNKPDTYVAIVAPRGRFIFGRSGAVRTGSPGVNIIGLDKMC